MSLTDEIIDSTPLAYYILCIISTFSEFAPANSYWRTSVAPLLLPVASHLPVLCCAFLRLPAVPSAWQQSGHEPPEVPFPVLLSWHHARWSWM